MLPAYARPTEAQTLLVRAAHGPADEAPAAWEQWKQLVGGIDLHDAASYPVLPAIYRRLAALGVDDSDLARLKGVYRHTWYSNHRVLHRTADVLRRFSDAGIPTILLKGAALIELQYADVGCRPMADFDVLVPVDRSRDGYDLLAQEGWDEWWGFQPERLFAVKHSTEFRKGDDRVDLHWYSLFESVDDSDFWRGSQPLTVRGAETRALCTTDQLLHVIVHGTGLWGAPVTWIADSLAILERSRDTIDWDRLAELAVAMRVTLRTAAALRLLEREFAASIPPAAVKRLESARPTVGEHALRWASAHASFATQRNVCNWDRWRRLRRGRATRISFATYLQWTWNVDTRRAVAQRLAGPRGRAAIHALSSLKTLSR